MYLDELHLKGQKSSRNKQFVEELKSKNVIQARSCGTILAFEVAGEETKYLNDIKYKIMKGALREGILLRPLGNTVYIMPPYCITPIQLEKVLGFLSQLNNYTIA